MINPATPIDTLDEALDGVTHLCATAMTPRDFGPPCHAPRELMPELALGGTAVGSLLTACGGGGDSPAPVASFASASFVSMAAPSLAVPGDMAKTLVNSTLMVKFSDDSSQGFSLSYAP